MFDQLTNTLKIHFLTLLLFAGVAGSLFAQDSTRFRFPDNENWTRLDEGDTLIFSLSVADSLDRAFLLGFETADNLGLSLDSAGVFTWIPSYDLVDRLKETETISVLFEAIFDDGSKLREEVDFVIRHVNRPPVVDDLAVFYVGQGADNQQQLNQLSQIYDPDGDPIIFQTNPLSLPEGASLTENGLFRWKPSRNQFRQLRETPYELLFSVEDQPFKSSTQGKLVIAPTQMDLPPEIVMVPNDTLFTIREDEILNLNFYFSDPNGDDDIQTADFVANDPRIGSELLQKNTATQYEFTWMPGYDFVEVENGHRTVEFTFFVLDQSNRRSERNLRVKVQDSENLIEKDLRLYGKYRGILVETMNLIAHLDMNQEQLNKRLKKAKKGQKNRAIMNASLGAVTGIGPVFLEEPTKNYISGIGGTTVLTMGTLEATDVIGASKDDILTTMKINIDMRNLLQTEGDQFARKYALKSRRRDGEFYRDLDKLKKQLNNKQLILLDLDASWENPKKPTDANLRKTFPDFNNTGYEN